MKVIYLLGSFLFTVSAFGSTNFSLTKQVSRYSVCRVLAPDKPVTECGTGRGSEKTTPEFVQQTCQIAMNHLVNEIKSECDLIGGTLSLGATSLSFNKLNLERAMDMSFNMQISGNCQVPW